MAERVGFEPTVPHEGTTVFETAPIDRSGTSPFPWAAVIRAGGSAGNGRCPPAIAAIELDNRASRGNPIVLTTSRNEAMFI